jgi:hypothetical protein
MAGLLAIVQASWAPHLSDNSAMKSLLTSSEDREHELVAKWRDNKLAELTMVAVTVVLSSAVRSSH